MPYYPYLVIEIHRLSLFQMRLKTYRFGKENVSMSMLILFNCNSTRISTKISSLLFLILFSNALLDFIVPQMTLIFYSAYLLILRKMQCLDIVLFKTEQDRKSTFYQIKRKTDKQNRKRFLTQFGVVLSVVQI